MGKATRLIAEVTPTHGYAYFCHGRQPLSNVLGSHIYEFLDLPDTPALGGMQRTEATGLSALAFLSSVPAPFPGLIGSMLRPPLRIARIGCYVRVCQQLTHRKVLCLLADALVNGV